MKQYSAPFDVVDDILKKTQQEIENMPPINILVVGKTGVGKSTLINHLFRDNLAETGVGKPVTQHLRKITKQYMPLNLYDTRGLEMDARVQAEIQTEIFELIDEHQGTEEAIQFVYYCVNAFSNRIEELEIKFINKLAKKTPVILVLTQSIQGRTDYFQASLETLNLHVAAIQQVMAKPFVINDEVMVEPFGLKELLDKSFELVPTDHYHTLNNIQIVDLKRKVAAARKWTTGYITSTFGIGFVPIPFADASLLVPMQVTMLAHITAIFGIAMDQSTLVSLIGAVGGTSSATFLGRTIVSNAFKFMPGVGTIVGGLISGATASTITSALGFSYIEVLTLLVKQERVGTLNIRALQKMMVKQFKKQLNRRKDAINTDEVVLEKSKMKNIFTQATRILRQSLNKREQS